MSEEEIKQLQEKIQELKKEVSGDDIYIYIVDNLTTAQSIL